MNIRRRNVFSHEDLHALIAAGAGERAAFLPARTSRQALAETIYNADDVAGAMAESNASFPDEPDMDIECPPTTDLWAAVDEWTIEADGTMTGEYDPEGDRMFNGDTLNCRGWLIYRKAGRAGLVFIEGDGTGGADDSWRDLDRDDEWAYQQSLGSNPAN